ncbi:MAG: ATP-binding protein [Oscillospiraceae bacterium]|nr:ATP-binding protein [Oscillospiraceae bacterium]
MRELTIAATIDALDAVNELVEAQLDETDCSMRARMQIGLAVEEIFVNIASYAYAPETGEATVQVGLTPDGSAVCITFIDQGVPYDPLAKEDPDVSLPLEKRPVGGLGILLVKNIMDDVRYEHTDGKNILTIVKKLAP